jgi:hypothetical protein
MIIQPCPAAVEVGPHEAIDTFTVKHGIHGCLLAAETRELLEVRQLDFRLRSFAGPCEAIPEADRPAYNRALMDSGLMLTAVGHGAQYNVPVGMKRWVAPDEETYEELSQLPVLGLG